MNFIRQEVLITCCKTGNIKKVKELLDDGVDPSFKGNYAIQWAARGGHVDIVKMLLKDSRVDPSNDNNAAIKWAADGGHVEIVKLLLRDDRVDPSDNNNYVIRWAAHNGHEEIVKLLLQDDRVDYNKVKNGLMSEYGIKIINNCIAELRDETIDQLFQDS